MKTYILITLFLLTVRVTLLGQNLDLKFENINIKDGLSNNVINDIKRDHNGFMWFATEDGLNRYDGKNFKIYRTTSSKQKTLLSNAIYSLYCDTTGILLVGTGKGLCKYNFDKDNFEPLIYKVIVNDVTKRKNGEYAVATNDGIYTISSDFLKTDKLITKDLLSENITDIIEDNDNNLWFSYYHNGIGSISSEGKVQNYSKKFHNLDADICKDIIINHKGEVVIGTYDNGIFTYNKHLDWFLPLPLNAREAFGQSKNPNINKVLSIHEDDENRLWFGTDGAGLGLYDTTRRQIKNYIHVLGNGRSISDNVVNSIFTDGCKGFWIGTFHKGVSFVNQYSNNFKHIHYLPSYKNVNIASCFKKDRLGNLWVGTDGGGLICRDLFSVVKGDVIFDYSQDTKDDEFSRSTSSYNILTLETDTLDHIWAGSYFGGIDIIDLFSKKKIYNYNESNSKLPSNVVWNIKRDQFGDIWCSTLRGLAKYNYQTDNFDVYNINNTSWKSENIRCILRLDINTILIGSSKGLIHYNLSTNQSKIYEHLKSDHTSLNHDFILNIIKDHNDNIWIGTYGGGLALFDIKNGSFQNWTTADGLCNNFICTILEGNDGNLWLTTSDGLSCFNPVDKSFKNFHFRDGIQEDKFSIGAGINWNDKKLLIGGINGYNSFIPSKIKTNTFPPPLQFIDFKIFNESIDFNKKGAIINKHISLVKEVELNYDENTIVIEFAALNFIQNENNLVSYYLEGIDKDWSTPENVNKANYTNLSPGDYTFRVKGSNNHGVWNEKELTLKIVVNPPFWQTWWFIISTAIIIIGLTALVIKNRIQGIIEQKQELEKEVAIRTEEINLKNVELEGKETRMVQSLNYAKLIQTAILPSAEEFKNKLDDFFIFYKPHSIVSGDFYWFDQKGPLTIIAAIDCTGHGVPGAFMSMMGNALLNKIVQTDNISSPSKILQKLHQEVISSLHQKDNHNTDGMDMSLVVINHDAKKLHYAGAMNPLVYFQNNQQVSVRATRRSIGGFDPELNKEFIEHEIDISSKTTFYLYSDGYQDQFGTSGKKFMTKRFKSLLTQIHALPMDQQNKILDDTLNSWTKNKVEQTDDILVIGVRI